MLYMRFSLTRNAELKQLEATQTYDAMKSDRDELPSPAQTQIQVYRFQYNFGATADAKTADATYCLGVTLPSSDEALIRVLASYTDLTIDRIVFSFSADFDETIIPGLKQIASTFGISNFGVAYDRAFPELTGIKSSVHADYRAKINALIAAPVRPQTIEVSNATTAAAAPAPANAGAANSGAAGGGVANLLNAAGFGFASGNNAAAAASAAATDAAAEAAKAKADADAAASKSTGAAPTPNGSLG